MCSNAAFTVSASRHPFAAESAVLAAPKGIVLTNLSVPASQDMWRSVARRASSLPPPCKLSLVGESCPARHTPLLLAVPGFSPVCSGEQLITNTASETGRRWLVCVGLRWNGHTTAESSGSSRNLAGKGFDVTCRYRGFASVAEEVSPTDAEEETASIEALQELMEELSKDGSEGITRLEKSEDVQPMVLTPQPLPEQQQMQRQHQKQISGMGQKKYFMLRRRQIKIETEAWEQAAKEYRELLVDMCEQKLAPNLPYMKSLFLGWFEPLRNKIEEEQQAYREGKSKAAYGPYFDQLPAEMMSVITMHKLMGLLMTGGGDGSTRVIQAACQVGEAIEQEVGKK